MGGGDLNSKKSWHPNTMKNQERVWKAEQAVAEEKKRMIELQRERVEERDRAELNNIMKQNSNSTTNDNRLSWMYDKPDKKVDQEAYLLGKSINKNPEQSDKLEQDAIPAVSRRVVGSSMLTTAGDAQVDMSRKIREDPLLLIKERERAARAALLNNPLQRRRLTELLRKEQDLKKERNTRKKSKKKKEKKDKDLDDLLAAKLNALGGQNSINIATLLDSDDSSSDSSPDSKTRNKKKKKHVKEKKKKKERKHSRGESVDYQSTQKETEDTHEDTRSSKRSSEHRSDKKNFSEPHKRSSGYDSEGPSKRVRQNIPERRERERESETDYKNSRYYDKTSTSRYSGRQPSRDQERRNKDINQGESRKRTGMSEEEKAAKLAEMAAAGASREIERGRRVAEQRAADLAETRAGPARARHDARALPDSLETRLHSNRHYIQRDKRHMNEHFARR